MHDSHIVPSAQSHKMAIEQSHPLVNLPREVPKHTENPAGCIWQELYSKCGEPTPSDQLKPSVTEAPPSPVQWLT